jgi:excisionase family DNA binding protein
VSASGRLLTAREVAERLAVSVETVLRWHRRGDLPGVRLSSTVLRFDGLEVDAYIAERSGRGKARPSALTPAAADSTRPLLSSDSDSSRSPRRETTNAVEEERPDE